MCCKVSYLSTGALSRSVSLSKPYSAPGSFVFELETGPSSKPQKSSSGIDEDYLLGDGRVSLSE